MLEQFVTTVNNFVWGFGFTVGGETLPVVVIALLGTGVFLTLRLGFIQLRRIGHGFAVTSGKYDDPDEPGDVPHFQALTTALSATVGIGNIAGVAIAIHWGGPGALFWMWMTALLGMAVKYSEVTLAQHYRVTEPNATALTGSVSGGPMYYIERGLGKHWKPLAIFFAIMLGFTAFLTGNAVQANTVADTMLTEFSMPAWATGLITSAIVASVVLGGIKRIGRVTAIMAPVMAAVYVLGAAVIILLHFNWFVPAVTLIFTEAFSPSAGVAGTGIGAILTTMMWGVRRGLFSNEAGQGSAPIAHAAAKTDEPVSEGVVALLEPFIDTLVICTMTGLVIIMTQSWQETTPTALALGSGDRGYVLVDDGGVTRQAALADAPASLRIENGAPVDPTGIQFAWHEAPVGLFYTDAGQTMPFTGVIRPTTGDALADDGTTYGTLYGPAVESGAPLTMMAFREGLPGTWGRFIVLFGVLLFAISTAISWSYYGDRCANYLFGAKAILPYKVAFIGMHFFGAMVSLQVIWDMGDIALGIVILPNLLALWLLSGKVKEMTDSYFQRRPWESNLEKHKQLKAQGKKTH
jgi:AGCS family alanine or glycine:cation symporter